MKTKSAQYVFWTSTILISLWFGASGFFELTKNELIWNITQQLGYPAHFIYLLGVLKILGVLILVLPNRLLRLKEWVYAGIFFDILFAFVSKLTVLGLSSTVDAIIAFTIAFTSYLMFRKLYNASYAINTAK